MVISYQKINTYFINTIATERVSNFLKHEPAPPGCFTRLNAQIYRSESSLPHCWCFLKDNCHQSCCKITGRFIVKRSPKWYFCFRSARCRENLSMWKVLLLEFKKNHDLIYHFFWFSLPSSREEPFSLSTTWSGWEERAGCRCQRANRRFGRCVGSRRRLFWQRQQLVEGRKRSPTNHLFLKPYFFRS